MLYRLIERNGDGAKLTIALGIRGHDVGINDPTTLADTIAKSGFKCVHLAPMKSFNDILPASKKLNPGLSNELAVPFIRSKVPLSILGCYTNIIDPNEKTRQYNIELIKNYLLNARWFDNAVVATETGSMITSGFTQANFSEEAFEQVIVSVSEICSYAESIGAIFAIEPGMNHPVNSISRVKELLNIVGSPNLKVVYDLSNLVYSNNVDQQSAIIDESFDSFGKEIVSFHLKDFVSNENGIVTTTMGNGQLYAKEYLSKIIELAPNSFVTLEGLNFIDSMKAKQAVNDIVENL